MSVSVLLSANQTRTRRKTEPPAVILPIVLFLIVIIYLYSVRHFIDRTSLTKY